MKKGQTKLSEGELRQALRAKLATSALTEQDGKKMRLKPMTADQTVPLKLPAAVGGFQIPYFSIDGRPTKFFRFRYMEDTRKGFDTMSGKKALRYAQPPNSETELYLPPFVDWSAIAPDAELPLLITEGELKAACATKHGYPTLGLGGVWSFQSKKQGQALLSIFEAFEFKERAVYIIFDSDAVTNPDVVGAELRLANRLVERGARVFICRLPSHAEVKKVGLDDYILLHGTEALRAQVLDNAFEFSESVALHELNKRVLYVRDPGFVWDHEMTQKLSPGAFKEHAFSNVHFWEKRIMKSGEALVKVPAAKAWLEWEHRSECRGLVYQPGRDRITEDGLLNTWKGWGVDSPRKGDTSQWNKLLSHIFGDDAEARHWFEMWCAFPLQNPGVKMATAAAIWGPVHGSGKTLIGHTIMRIYGRNAVELKDADLEDTRFEWAENRQFVLADDITSRGDRKFMRKLMTMITQKYLRLDPKYVPSYFIVDLMNYMFTSNEPDALFMDDQDRRFFVHETKAPKFAEYREYVKWRDSDEGISALWHYFLDYDTTGFDPQAPAPQTLGKESMIELGKSDLGAWVFELRQNTEQVLGKANLRGDLFTASELHLLYDPMGDKRASTNALARELKRAGVQPPATGNKIRLPDGSMKMVYAVRNGDEWIKRSWKEACDHYAESHNQGGKKTTRKF